MNSADNNCEEVSPSPFSTSLWDNRQSRRAWLKPTLACFLILLTMQVASAQESSAHKTESPPNPFFDKNQFVLVPAGEFMMGSASRKSDEKLVHRVRISRGFEMGKYEVTQAQWEAVTGNNPSKFKGENLPVENVSWDDVQQFLRALNARNDGYVYRLPTEAEWEYACRAGSMGYYAGNLDAMAWYGGNSEGQTHPVGQKQANKWGLYDMHGNVWEWCQDWYGSNYSNQSPATDPQGPGSGSYRVDRGGGWFSNTAECRSAFRYCHSPGYRFYGLGFRLLRTAK